MHEDLGFSREDIIKNNSLIINLCHKYRKNYDIIHSIYHDQGLIPFKMLAFDSGVNTTLNLPFVRTSPDHGTAYDIAWQNKASAKSMEEAILLAIKMYQKS